MSENPPIMFWFIYQNINNVKIGTLTNEQETRKDNAEGI